jgi:maltose alpha-D-glucosyltransferase/alpha-amylase
LDERWYKNGLIYELSVRTFRDGNGDGIGDVGGLIERLDYLNSLGVTCLWLLPFYPSPWRDDGYDITDHCAVHPDLGSPGDVIELVRRAGDRGMRVIVDLVLNHTSDQHPWFQAARAGHPKYRDYYIWSTRKPPNADKGVVFPGVQKSTWSYDRKARRYYFHRFYDFQPDLNVSNPAVREEMERIIAFWLQLGVAGFRVDAVPFLIEPAGIEGSHPKPRFDYLHQFRNLLSWRRGDAILLGEANVERHAIEDYFGVGGMHLLFNFPANRALWLALATEDARPLLDGLKQTVGIPSSDQWANFLRNHDEIDLGRLSDRERAATFEAFAPKPTMQLYGRGIRRRLAPMLGGDRRRLELAFSLLLTLPGTPVVYYGDEIGMGEQLSLRERESVRTAMQWSNDRNGGFSPARSADVGVPVVSAGPFGFRKVNVVDQLRNEGSLLNWVHRAARTRAACPEFGTGGWRPIGTGDPAVLAISYQGDGGSLVALHNLSGDVRRVRLRLNGRSSRVTDVFGDQPSPAVPTELRGYGYRWLRVPGGT